MKNLGCSDEVLSIINPPSLDVPEIKLPKLPKLPGDNEIPSDLEFPMPLECFDIEMVSKD